MSNNSTFLYSTFFHRLVCLSVFCLTFAEDEFRIVVLQVLENSIQELYSQGSLQSLERALTAYRGRAMEKEQIIVREEETKLEIQQLTEQLDTLKASEVEMRKKEMRKIAELKVCN